MGFNSVFKGLTANSRHDTALGAKNEFRIMHYGQKYLLKLSLVLLRSKCITIPIQDYYRLTGFQEIEFSKFRDIQYKKVVMKTLCTGLLFSQGSITGTYFCWSLTQRQSRSAAGRIMFMAPSRIEPATFLLVAHHVPPFASQFSNILTCGKCDCLDWFCISARG